MLILAEIETAYGTDPTPTIAANALIVNNPVIDYLFESKERSNLTTGYPKLAPLQVGQGVKISFSHELKGGVANLSDAPALDPLLIACGLKGIADAGVSYSYEPECDVEGDSVTIWYYQDTILHKVTGCRGTFKISLTAGEIAFIDFEFTGLYGGTITDVTFPTLSSISYSAVPPVVFNTAAFTYNSVACVISKFEFDLGNNVTKRMSANAATGVAGYAITGRETKGSFDPEVLALASLNPWAIHAASTAYAIVCNVGTVAKSIVLIDVFRCILDVPKYGERDNIATYDLTYKTTGILTGENDDFRLTFK